MVIYGRRNSGKTSLVLSKIIPEFRRRHPQSFVLMVDLMQVKSLESINTRFKVAFESAFSQSFPAKNILTNISKFFSHLTPSIEIDTVTGTPSLSIKTNSPQNTLSFLEILKIIQQKISKEMPTLVVMDEFQDIALVDESAGLMRSILQHFSKTPVILMGSQQDMLAKMFSSAQAPFADFGVDISFQEIPYEKYHQYILERFRASQLDIDLETAILWQNILNRNPESINIVGAYLVHHHLQKKIAESDILFAVDRIVHERKSRFEELLTHLSMSQENVLIAFAKYGPVLEPTSKYFLQHLSLSHATVMKNVKQFLWQSILERSESGIRITNPLLKFYLKRFR